MPTPDQMLPQRLMIIGRRLHSENHPLQPVLIPHRSRLRQKLPKPLDVVFKGQSPEKRLSLGGAKKGIVLLFGHIDAHDQILCRPPNLFPELTKLFQSGTIFFVHEKPPVDEFEFGGTYSYLYTGAFFFEKCGVTYKIIFFYFTLWGMFTLCFDI
jgi:hypothetical protein